MNAEQTNGQHRTSVGRKWPNDSFEILFLLLCCSSSFKFLHLRLPIVFVSFRVLSNSLTPNVGSASCPNFVSRFIHKKRKSRIACEGGSNRDPKLSQNDNCSEVNLYDSSHPDYWTSWCLLERKTSYAAMLSRIIISVMASLKNFLLWID